MDLFLYVITMCCISKGTLLIACFIIYTLMATGTITAGVLFENLGEIIGGTIATALEVVYIIYAKLCKRSDDKIDTILECCCCECD